MPRLTDSQLVILSAAAQRDAGAALPLPKSLKLNRGAATTVLKSLVKRGLLAERPARGKKAIWREDRDGTHVALVITEAGRTAIGIEADEPGPGKGRLTKARGKIGKRKARASKKPIRSRNASGSQSRPGSKQALLVELLSRRQGASIAEAVEATGWQAHSVRGAISGTLKKKLGLSVTSEPHKNRSRVYRIAGR